MLNKIVMSTLLSSILLLSGCGGDSEAEDRLAVQEMLDKGDYDGVIRSVESRPESDANNLLLASAYMGKAGYSILDIVSALANEEGDTVSSLGKKSTFRSTLDLDKAGIYYKKVVGEDTCKKDQNVILSGGEKDICLFLGLSSVSKVASTVSLLVDDIDNFGNSDSNVTDYKLKASTCAMEYAFDNNGSEPSDCTITPDDNVTFTLTAREYTPITVKPVGTSESFYYLMTPPVESHRQTALTSGYCTNESFTPRLDDYNASATPKLYPCPINESKDGNETTSMDVLIDALNGGVDSVLVATGGQTDSEDNDIESSVDEFKCEVLDGTYNSDTKTCSSNTDNSEITLSDPIEEDQVINYLDNQNN